MSGIEMTWALIMWNHSWCRTGHQDVLGRFFCILHIHIEITVVFENTRVDQLVLELVPRPPPVGFYQIRVRVRALRVLVEPFHVGVRGRRVEVEIVFLDVLAVIALAIGQPKEPLLKDVEIAERRIIEAGAIEQM